MARPPKIPLVHVWWVDSTVINGWRHMADIEKEPVSTQCQTVGWLVKETKEELQVAGSVGDLNDPHMQVTCRMTIPRCAVAKMKRLRHD